MNNNSSNRFSWKVAVPLSFGVGLLAAGVSIFFQTHGLSTHYLFAPIPTAIAETAPLASTTPSVGSSFQVPGQPMRLIIPSIAVDANIQSVGLFWNGDGSMGIPTNFTDVAWYNGGPLPGEPGSAVIDGHLDGKNVAQAVFYKLGDLKVGDLVEVIDNKGKTLQFKVVGSKEYAYNATTTDIFAGDVSKARLNLITCAGDWDKATKLYSQRVVIFTELATTE
jgi:LPXTG-site transpeptidase (sortase) family protein